MKNEKIENLLNYFYNLEFCNPFTPNDIAYDTKNEKHSLPKIPGKRSTDENKKYVFTIYVGVFDYKEILKEITNKFQIKNCKELHGTTECTICGFKVDENAHYINGSFSISPFLYAISKLLKMETDFSESELFELQEKLENKIDFSSINGQITESILNQILEIIQVQFEAFSSFFSQRIQIAEDLVFKEIEDNFPAILSSFYLHDLAMIKQNLDEKIVQFLSLEEKDRILICRNEQELKRVLHPKNYPLGKWPSTHNPGLMQQVAINIGIRDHAPIFSVNGPPGSGKTTLVKEIIASILVDRARELIQFENPDDAFLEIQNENPKDGYQASYYKLHPSLKKYGILVASNNNNAVENITLELPIASDVKKQKTRTSLFDRDDYKEIYFTKLTDAINKKEENWGLISVRMGKKANINQFLHALWFNKESDCRFQDYLNIDIDFEKCKVSFQKKLKEVLQYRSMLETVEKEVEELEINKEKIKMKTEELETIKEQVKPLLEQKKKIVDKLENLEKMQKEYQKLVSDINKALPWYVKILSIFFSKNVLLQQRKELLRKLEETEGEYFAEKVNILKLNFEIQEQEKLEKEKEKEIENLKQIQTALSKKQEGYRQEEIVIADADFYKDIDKNKKSQKEAPWTNGYYDKLREELFYKALQVHKSFVLNSPRFKKNLNFAVNMLNNSGEYSEMKEKCFGEFFNTLFLLVPVISTTLASVERFLKDIKKEEIGYLIIDEAGQATPSSVLGAIYRAKKTIVLGDPLQIEPVVSTPEELYLVLDSKDKINAHFHDRTLSAQVLADVYNPYGELRKGEPDQWIGCPLLLHRRCLEPMFSISNKIAYNGKMFYCTEDGNNKKEDQEEKDIFPVSEWLDIKGEEISKENHYVEEQGQKVLEFVEKGIGINHGQFPSLYIITPFKSVANEMKKKLIKRIPEITSFKQAEIRNWVHTHCGTVHTFQGKEAKEVILVLGCSQNSLGAIQWAGTKPNILNVAVSRAKRKMIILGDVSLWKNVPNFSTAYKYLLKEKEE